MSHEICIPRLFLSVLHPRVVGGCSGQSVRSAGSVLGAASRVTEGTASYSWNVRCGLLRAVLVPAGKVSSSSRACFTQAVVCLAAAAGGRAPRLPAAFLLAPAPCPSCLQQTGFLIKARCIGSRGACHQSAAAGERWLSSSRALSDGRHWLGKLWISIASRCSREG